MGISVKGRAEDLKARFEAFAMAIEKEKVELLDEVGEHAVAYARGDHPQNWEDQTGNLRSSLGYAIYQDGNPLVESFGGVGALSGGLVTPQSTQGAGAIGQDEGKRLAKAVASSRGGLTLVVTAGMHYALYVEAKGFDVLTGAKLTAERKAKAEMQRLVRDLQEAWREAWK